MLVCCEKGNISFNYFESKDLTPEGLSLKRNNTIKMVIAIALVVIGTLAIMLTLGDFMVGGGCVIHRPLLNAGIPWEYTLGVGTLGGFALAGLGFLVLATGREKLTEEEAPTYVHQEAITRYLAIPKDEAIPTSSRGWSEYEYHPFEVPSPFGGYGYGHRAPNGGSFSTPPSFL